MNIIFMGCNISSNKKNDNDILITKTKENTNKISFKDQIIKAKVVHVYDGDTIHVVFNALGDYYKWNCRIYGIDTPELRTKNSLEKEKGYEIKKIVSDHFLNKIVDIKCYDFDKYGRLLIDIFLLPEIDNPKNYNMLSEWMVDNKYAHSYFGGTKKKW